MAPATRYSVRGRRLPGLIEAEVQHGQHRLEVQQNQHFTNLTFSFFRLLLNDWASAGWPSNETVKAITCPCKCHE